MPFPLLIPAITAAAGFLGKHGGTIKKVAGAAAPILGGLAKGRAEGKVADANLATNQDALRARLYEATTRNMLDRARLGADRAGFELNAPSARFGQAIRGGLAANMQDVVAQVPERYAGSKVTFTGGLRPSALGPQGREAGAKLAQLALERMGHDTFDLPDLPSPPGVSSLPQSGFGDKLLGIAGPVTAGIGALEGVFGMPGGAVRDYVGDAVRGIDQHIADLQDDPRYRQPDMVGDIEPYRRGGLA